MKEIDVKELIEVADKLGGESQTYLYSYEYFIQYFAELESIEEKHLVLGINFVYAWMPRIFKFKDGKTLIEKSEIQDKIGIALGILNKVKKDGTLEPIEFEILKKLFNNSLVGTSKLLHFIAPEKYAIWDSKICSYFFQIELPKKSKQIQIENIGNYMKYLECLKNLESEELEKVVNNRLKKLGFSPVTKLRAIELAIFEGQKQK